MINSEIRDGYYALEVAIRRGCTVEKAFNLFRTGNKRINWITPEIEAEMFKMRMHYHLSLVEMAEIYGVDFTFISKVVRRYKKKAASLAGLATEKIPQVHYTTRQRHGQ